MGLVLTPEGEELLWEFQEECGYNGNCSCHISPPCGSCTHPGNPLNLEGDPSLWEEEWEGFDVMESRARQVVEDVIERATIHHLREMKEKYGSK